MHKCK